MADNKKSFILYTDLIHTVSKMPNDKAGELLKHILNYVNDKNPQTDDLIIQLTFEPIKQQLKRDLKKYETKKDQKSESAKLGNLKRWHVDLYDQVLEQKLTVDEAYEIVANHRKPSHSDNSIAKIAVNDIVNVTDTVNDILLEKETKELFNEWLDYRKEIRKPIKAKKTLIALAEKIKKNGFKISNQIITTSIENGWQGLFWDKHVNTQSSNNKKTKMLSDVMKQRAGIPIDAKIN